MQKGIISFNFFLPLLIVIFLFTTSSSAKTKIISSELSINIPSNYKYFELTYRQLVSRFPEILSHADFNEFLGIGMNAKLIIIANNQKTINFFNDASSVTGLEKLNRKYLQPFMQKISDPNFEVTIMRDIQQIAPNRDIKNMSEQEITDLISNHPKIIKRIEKILNPIIKKFIREYNPDKYTVLLIGDKKTELLDEIKKFGDINNLTKIVKEGLVKVSEESGDPSLKGLKNWQFKIEKNKQGNLYFYSNDSVPSPYVPSKRDQEFFLTSHKEKIILAFSECYSGCDGLTDFANIIKPTNLYINSNSNREVFNNNNLAEQLKSLNELYKSNSLTKEEYKKAKAILLN